MIFAEREIKFEKEKTRNRQPDAFDLSASPISQDVIYKIIRYFPTIIIDDEQERKEQCEYCIQELKHFIKENESDPKIVQYILAKLTLVASLHPYEDVHLAYTQLGKEILKSHPDMVFGEHSRISLFFSNNLLPDLQKNDLVLVKDQTSPENFTLERKLKNKEFYKLYKDIYKFWHGRITNFERVLFWYPENLRKMFNVMKHLFQDDGPLTLPWRYYIAILSVACYDCEYLYWLLHEKYLLAGGDKDWLQGINSKSSLPQKLKNILQFCVEFAFKPWMFKDGVKMSELLRGSDAWSKHELVQAVFIIAYFHALCGPIYALGILPEIDFPRDLQKDFIMKADDQALEAIRTSPRKCSNTKVIDLLKKMQNDPPRKDEQKKSDKSIKEKKFEEIFSDKFDGTFTSKAKIFERFYGNKEVSFTSFSSRDMEGTFSDDYNWDLYGYSETTNYFPELADAITEAHSYITNLTLRSFGDVTNINTQPFRKAVYYYTQNIHGFSCDEYNYREVNQMLHRDFKNFIKYAASLPQKINFSILDKVPVELKPHDICHIALLVFDAKFQVEVMYGLLGLRKK